MTKINFMIYILYICIYIFIDKCNKNYKFIIYVYIIYIYDL